MYVERYGYPCGQGVAPMELELTLRSTTPHAGTLEDEVRRLRAENEALRHASTHDLLTDLLNRRGFCERADHLLDGVSPDVVATVMMLDLNWFKQVNDCLGHAAGDSVLQEVAARLTAYAGASWPLLARLSGDEFAGLRVGPDDPGCLHAHAMWLAVALAAPMDIAGHRLAVGAAIGLVVSGAPVGLGELLRRADEAMYRAKGMEAPAAVLWDPRFDSGDETCEPRPRVRTRDLPRPRAATPVVAPRRAEKPGPAARTTVSARVAAGAGG